MHRLRGVVPIVSTPFDTSGALAVDELAREVDWLCREGVNGVGIAIASEIFALDPAEWEQVVSTVVRATDGRVPVVASVGREDAAATADRAGRAAELGASMVMAYPPRGTPVTGAKPADYYRTIGEVGGDVWVQDAPQMTEVELSLDAYRAIYEDVSAVCGYKVEAHPTADKIRAVRGAIGGDPVVLGGAGGLNFPDELEAGSEGTMPGASMARAFVEEWEAFTDGGVAAARAVHARSAKIWTFIEERSKAFIHMEKLALRARGIFSTDACRFSPERLNGVEQEQWLTLLGLSRTS